MNLRSSEALFDSLPDSVFENDFLEWIVAAHCWDHYGLPDGRLNPSHGNTSYEGHCTIEPTDVAINLAFNAVIKPTLNPNEEWLLDIPRKKGSLGTVNATILKSNNNAAIVMPRGFFGMLFCVNEMYWEHNVSETALLPSEIKKLWENKHRSFLELCLLGKPDKDWVTNIMDLDQIRYHRNRQDTNSIWAMTTIQQVFIILHEFGHLIHENKFHDKITTDSIGKEIQADNWALKKIWDISSTIQGCSEDFCFQCLFLLFAMTQVLQPESAQYLLRCINTAEDYENRCNVKSKTLQKEIQEAFDDIDKIFV